MTDSMSEKRKALLQEVCDAQTVSPYRGWNLTALNRVVDQIREHLGLPSIRNLNPDIAAMQDAALANRGAIQAIQAPRACPITRLVIAARVVAFERQDADALRELDKASEAFASSVPWEHPE